MGSLQKAVAEISRVLKKGGVVWLNEGLTSEDYKARYGLSKDFIHDEHSFFVFKDKELSKSITRKDQLQGAIQNNSIDRIAHHFTEEELHALFNSYTTLYRDVVTVVSPRSHSQ